MTKEKYIVFKQQLIIVHIEQYGTYFEEAAVAWFVIGELHRC